MESDSRDEEVVIEMVGNNIGSSRWNPTKEQISMLESLYKQGIRTPTAEEIQHITARLRAYGHIEGKNVFYWFQNHKARQRQKLKQKHHHHHHHLHHHHTLSYLALRHHLFSSSPTVMCAAPYCMPREGVYYKGESGQQQQQEEEEEGGKQVVRRPRILATTTHYNNYNNNKNMMMTMMMGSNQPETLELFPMHPTGILQGKQAAMSNNNNNNNNNGGDHSAAFIHHIHNANQNQPFFEFFTSAASQRPS